MYSRWSTQLSLADYAVISAFQSVKAGVERNTDGCDGPCSIDFTFVPGRRTCDNPDSPPRRPLPQGVDIHAPQGIAAEFGLTQEEMVALMGRLRVVCSIFCNLHLANVVAIVYLLLLT